MNYEYLHEVEIVELRTSTPRPISELLPVFDRLGFELHDDLVSFDRKEKIPPWQHSSIAEVEVQYNHEEIFGFDEGEWTTLRLKYLFASLPYELAEKFFKITFALSEQLATPVYFRGSIVSASELSFRFNQVRDELLSETGQDAGSEQLAILIQSTYPRRK